MGISRALPLAPEQEGHFNSASEGSMLGFCERTCVGWVCNQLSKAGVVVTFLCPAGPGRALLGFQSEGL